jgi:hypothetical protein
MRATVAAPEFVSLSDGRAQITLRTGQRRGGMIGASIGLFGIAVAVAFYVLGEAACLAWGCGGFGGLVLVLGVWALIRAAIVAKRLGDATLTVSHYPLRLGETFEVAYEQEVRATHEIGFVALTLRCEELARYRVGTDTHTVKHMALEEERTLLEAGTATPEAPLASAATFQIPAHAMHSFDQSHNKFTWTLKLRADIAKLPDYVAECKLEVLPLLAPEAGGNLGLVTHPAPEKEHELDEDDAEEDEGGEGGHADAYGNRADPAGPDADHGDEGSSAERTGR